MANVRDGNFTYTSNTNNDTIEKDGQLTLPWPKQDIEGRDVDTGSYEVVVGNAILDRHQVDAKFDRKNGTIVLTNKSDRPWEAQTSVTVICERKDSPEEGAPDTVDSQRGSQPNHPYTRESDPKSPPEDRNRDERENRMSAKRGEGTPVQGESPEDERTEPLTDTRPYPEDLKQKNFEQQVHGAKPEKPEPQRPQGPPKNNPTRR